MAETIRGGFYWVERGGRRVAINAWGEEIDPALEPGADTQTGEQEPSSKQTDTPASTKRTSS